VGYVEQNLVEGETVAYRGHLHWIVLARPLILALLLVVPGGIVLYLAFSQSAPSDRNAMLTAGFFLLVIGGLFFVAGMVRRNSAEFAVTSKRIILKRGVLRRKTEEIFLQRVESVGVDQDVLGRMLNYGTITVRGIGGTLEPFSHVSNALEFRRQVQEQIAKSV